MTFEIFDHVRLWIPPDVVILTMMIDARKLKAKIFADRYNRMIFEEGKGRHLYLVGGYIRDILRGEHSPDRDYIVSGNLTPFVNKTRKIINGTVVKFKKGDMVRIALKKGLTFDFSKLEATIEKDLSGRDFTINAMAWSPDNGITDLYNGQDDLKKKIIRCISRKNLLSDPLRMLRAYRFAAELNGSIEERTRSLIKILNNNIEKTSSERITLELFNLLNSRHSAKYLKMALSDGLLISVLFIPHEILESNIKAISLLERARINELPPRIKVQLNMIFSQNLTYKGLLCLELLLNSHFHSRERLPNIIISNAVRKRLELGRKGLEVVGKRRFISTKRLYDIFMMSGNAAVDVLIMSGRIDLIGEYRRFQRIWKRGVLNSQEIMKIAGIEGGPTLGRIIVELRRAEFEGGVKSKRCAVTFVGGLACKIARDSRERPVTMSEL